MLMRPEGWHSWRPPRLPKIPPWWRHDSPHCLFQSQRMFPTLYGFTPFRDSNNCITTWPQITIICKLNQEFQSVENKLFCWCNFPFFLFCYFLGLFPCIPSTAKCRCLGSFDFFFILSHKNGATISNPRGIKLLLLWGGADCEGVPSSRYDIPGPRGWSKVPADQWTNENPPSSRS